MNRSSLHDGFFKCLISGLLPKNIVGLCLVLCKPESPEGGPWGQPLKKPEGALVNLG